MSILLDLAVALLTRDRRDRYREQWRADLRDADEAGLRPYGIAWGALAFAITARRAWPSVSLDPVRMRRVAFALAFASAALGLTSYPDLGWGVSMPAPAYQVAVTVAAAVVTVVQVLGPIAAVALITGATGAGRTERVSIWLLVLAAAAPIVSRVTPSGDSGDTYLYPAALAYVLALGLIVVAVALRRPRAPQRPRGGAVAGATFTVAAVGAAAFLAAALPWFTRPAPDLSLLEGTPSLAVALDLIAAFEARATAVLVLNGTLLGLLVLSVALAGAARARFDLRIVTAGALLTIGYGFLLLSGFIALGTIGESRDWLPYDALWTLYRVALIATVFVAVDGIRIPGRTRRPEIA